MTLSQFCLQSSLVLLAVLVDYAASTNTTQIRRRSYTFGNVSRGGGVFSGFQNAAYDGFEEVALHSDKLHDLIEHRSGGIGGYGKAKVESTGTMFKTAGEQSSPETQAYIPAHHVGDQLRRMQRYVEALVNELSGLEAKHVVLQRTQSNTSRSIDQIVMTVNQLNQQLQGLFRASKDNKDSGDMIGGSGATEVRRLRKDLKGLRNKTHERIQNLKAKLWSLVNELTHFVNESNYNTTKLFRMTFRKINDNRRILSQLRNGTRSLIKDIVRKKLNKFRDKLDVYMTRKVAELVKNHTAVLRADIANMSQLFQANSLFDPVTMKRLMNRAADGCWETSCYYFKEIWVTWPEARGACQRIGGDLAAFETVKEEQQVMQLLPSWAFVNSTNTHAFWLAGSSPDTERWHWANTGEEFTHTNWLENYPIMPETGKSPTIRTAISNMLCLKTCFEINNGKSTNGWCNTNCYEKNPYICEV